MEETKNLRKETYFTVTKSATYGFLAALPLFVIYELLILLVNGDRMGEVRVGADVWIKQLLALVGANGMWALAVVVLVSGIVVFVKERKNRPPIKPAFLAWMIGESAIYAVFVAFLVSFSVGMLFSMTLSTSLSNYVPALIQSASPNAPGTMTMLVLSIGAGLYEELIFRVVLVGGLFLILNNFLGKRNLAYVIAAVIGAFIFSSVHYIGALGDVFTLSSFTFRFLFGLVLNVIFLLRGFGVAAWTHAIYDILVVSHLLG
ncbi:CPBP family intramembrane metalloprotease [bacterium]|nr:CPBP family intramembrane metalloprotease [bacterium]